MLTRERLAKVLAWQRAAWQRAEGPAPPSIRGYLRRAKPRDGGRNCESVSSSTRREGMRPFTWSHEFEGRGRRGCAIERRAQGRRRMQQASRAGREGPGNGTPPPLEHGRRSLRATAIRASGSRVWKSRGRGDHRLETGIVKASFGVRTELRPSGREHLGKAPSRIALTGDTEGPTSRRSHRRAGDRSRRASRGALFKNHHE